MRRIVAAAIAVTLVSGAAHGQGMKLTNPRQHLPDNPQQAADEDARRAKEKDYKSALDRIPAQTGTVDPWQSVREKPGQSKAGR